MAPMEVADIGLYAQELDAINVGGLIVMDDPPDVIETITTAARLARSLGTAATPALYWIRGDLGNIGGIFGANPAADHLPRAPRRDGPDRLPVDAGVQHLRFEHIQFTAPSSCGCTRRSSTARTTSSSTGAAGKTSTPGFASASATRSPAQFVEDILIDSCTFRASPSRRPPTD
jgi:hypothetical protein